VFSIDLFGMQRSELPSEVVFEGKRIGAPAFVEDARALDLATTESTSRALRGSTVPLVALTGTEDRWVDPSDVRRALGDAQMRTAPVILELERAGHDLTVNAAIGREVLRRTVMHARELAGVPLELHELREPTFEEIAKHSLYEKRIQRAQRPKEEMVA
jgi:hypothetical protein